MIVVLVAFVFDEVALVMFTLLKLTFVRLTGLVVVEFIIVEVPLIPSDDAVTASK